MSCPLFGMGEEYSDRTRPLPASGALLALDTGSPTASVAVGRAGEVLALRSHAQRGSSESLLRLIADCLEEAGLRLDSLDGCLVARGPGSFTGLRVGLSTVLGLHQASGLRVAALDTLPVVAAACRGSERVLAVVDALRGEWFSQEIRVSRDGLPEPLELPRLRSAEDLRAVAARTICGFGVAALGDSFAGDAALVEPGALAPTLLRLAVSQPLAWDAGRLTRPLYLRPPAAFDSGAAG